MKPSNNSDIALAQEWLASLDAHIELHGLKGFDPFDIKAHPYIRAAQQNYFFRKCTSLLCDLFPHSSRRLLKIRQTENPKAYALCAMGDLRMHALTQEQRYAERARASLAWLRDNANKAHPHPSWGYPFSFGGKGVEVPANTPITVVTAIAGLAFLEAYAQHGDAAHLEMAKGAAQFILEHMPRLDEGDGAFCFAYALCDTRRVHNANLLGAELLVRAGVKCGDLEMVAIGRQALAYTLRRQQEDGSWQYGESSEGEAHEASLMRMVDHHHSGFVLRSLQGIFGATQDEEAKRALLKGFTYYRTLFSPIGQPLSPHAAWPVDIHACAEAILCPSVISPGVFAAKQYATLSLRWTHYFMRDHKTDLPLYRKYPFYTSRICYPRWGLAWLYLALAEYLSEFYEEG